MGRSPLTGALTLVIRTIDHCAERSPLRALSGFELRVKPGEYVHIVDTNQQRLTRLAEILSLLYVGWEGWYLLDGRQLGELGALERFAMRMHYGIALRRRCVIPDLTVAENLEIPLSINCSRLRRPELIEQSLKSLGLKKSVATTIVAKLSPADQQLVALAKATVALPRLIVLQEPWKDLRPSAAAPAMRLLKRLSSNGHTIMHLDTASCPIDVPFRPVPASGER